MNRSIALFTTTGWLLATVMATAQSTSQSPAVFRQSTPVAAESQVPQICEEIEIFRRILKDALLKKPLGHAGQVHSLAFDPDGRWLASSDGTAQTVRPRYWDAHTGKELSAWLGHDGIAAGQGPEGMYLPGHGLVFTLTIPAPFYKPVGGPAKPGRKPLSQWEQVRNELRGVKVKPEEAKGEREEPSLADAVLKLLADNGRHFSLTDNQQVTVAITLRPMQACIACHTADIWGGSSTGGGGPGKMGSSGTGPASPATKIEGSTGGKGPPSYFPASEAPITRGQTTLGTANEGDLKDLEAKKVQAANFSHLGDSRLRQGRTQEAVEAYQKAVEIYQKLLEWKHAVPSAPKEALPDLTAATETYSKLAQAYLLLGDNERSFATLKTFTRLSAPTAGTGSQASTSKSVVSSPVVLPEKLMISAPKRLLDQVGTGKMSFEDFRKNATVEYLTFPTPEKGKQNPPTGGGTGGPAPSK